MYYSYRKINNYRYDKFQGYKIGYAESRDGINWKKIDNRSEFPLCESVSDWDYSMNEYCHIFFSKGKKIMLYNGNGFGKTGFGYAVYE